MTLDLGTQELVDEYLAAGGKITVCPPRTFAISVTDEGGWKRINVHNDRLAREAHLRRQRICDLHDQGFTQGEIARRVGMSPKTVSDHLHRSGRGGRRG